jgi:hypothetical protein
MQDRDLLRSALGLAPPWRVVRSEFDAARRRLDIHLDFAIGSRFACASCGVACPALCRTGPPGDEHNPHRICHPCGSGRHRTRGELTPGHDAAA